MTQEEINNQIKSLSYDDKFRLLHKIALIKVDKFLETINNISPETQQHIRMLSPLLMLPSNVRSEYSKALFQQKDIKHEKTKDALRFLKNSNLINSFLNLENKELSKRLYMDALYLRNKKKKYVTDLTIIKTMLKPIIAQLEKDNWEKYDITVLISDLFIHFRFNNHHKQDYQSVQKRTDALIRRL